DFAASMSAEAKRCGVALDPALRGVQSALAQLDAARALLYGKDASIPDAAAVFRSWEAATAAMEGPIATSARRAGWPSSLRPGNAGRMRTTALHLDAAAQLAALTPSDKPTAARRVAV